VVDGAEVMSEAPGLAAFWDAWPRATVTAWKQAQSALLQRRIEALPAVDASDPGGGDALAPSAATPIALASTVVTATARPDGVVVVTLQDRDAKNMFSPALVAGLKEAFAHIDAMPGCKAVVLTGYDSYFATGGTMETLLAIQQGQAQFTDEKVFQQPMDCALPVIAAIQGHGIGGGWSFGMFADLVLLSEESRYLSPYMGYGFTPGAGSTLMFPAKIGHDLARETLLTAQETSGHDLRARGVALPLLPRRDGAGCDLAGFAHRASAARAAAGAQAPVDARPARRARTRTAASFRCTSGPSCATPRPSNHSREVLRRLRARGRAGHAGNARRLVHRRHVQDDAGPGTVPGAGGDRPGHCVHRPWPRLDHRRDLDPQDQCALRHGHRGDEGLQPSHAERNRPSCEAGDREGGDARRARARCRARDDLADRRARRRAGTGHARAARSWRHQPHATPRIARTPTAAHVGPSPQD
jgi:enoyl-CoA hydratase/carnithine racemase